MGMREVGWGELVVEGGWFGWSGWGLVGVGGGCAGG